MVLSGINQTRSPAAETQFGRVDGHLKMVARENSMCEEFLGIPYAEPPARFEPSAPWSTAFPGGSFQASSLPSPCIQFSATPQPGVVGSEDCLYLNVWRPAGASQSSQLPVMLWIHGGGFKEGASESPEVLGTTTYDGCRLAALQDVIVVSLNYRLNLFGFAAFPQESNPELFHANLGLQDQREGMRWVQNHIASFGGKAESVTIFGESAGAQSVFFHILSPLSKGLFRAGIAQSGSLVAYDGEKQANLTARVGQAAGCTQPSLRECLLSSDAAELTLFAAHETADMLAPGWGITQDGVEVLEPLDAIMRQGEYAAVPLLLGYNTDEANLFTFSTLPEPIDHSTQREYLVNILAPSRDPVDVESLDEMLTLYNQKYPEEDGRYAVGALQSDLIFVCASVLGSRWHSSLAPTYLYRFDARPSCPPPIAPGAYHSIEIPYVFGNSMLDAFSVGCDYDTTEEHLLNVVQTRWANFARTLTPDGADAPPTWPAFTNATNQAIVIRELNMSLEVVTDEKLELCHRWVELSHRMMAS